MNFSGFNYIDYSYLIILIIFAVFFGIKGATKSISYSLKIILSISLPFIFYKRVLNFSLEKLNIEYLFSLQNKNHTTDALINKKHTPDAPIVVHQSQFPSKSQYDSLSKLSINATCSNAESCGEGGAPAWKRKFGLRNMLNLTLRTLI